MDENLDPETAARVSAYKNKNDYQLRGEALAADLLFEVRSKLRAEFPTLDDVGADALILNAMYIRAGRQRYRPETLEWLADAAYDYGYRQCRYPYRDRVFSPDGGRYNPFDLYHDVKCEVDEDFDDPGPVYIRPLKFLSSDLTKVEVDRGWLDQDTEQLLQGKDMDASYSL